MTDREYLFSYHFGGSTWGTSVWASCPDEAREKIKAIGLDMARYGGKLIATVPAVVPAAGSIGLAGCWWMNTKR